MSHHSNAPPAMNLQAIGVIHSPHARPEETPIQPVFARGIQGTAELLREYADGLRDIEGFSHLYLIYWLHRADAPRLVVKPFLDDTPRGVFATRAPCRPNPIGLSVVRLVRRDANVLHLEDVDVLDGTPLLDVKPYVPRFNPAEGIRCGWVESVDEQVAAERGRRAYGQGSNST